MNMLKVYQEINKRRQSNNEVVSPLTMFAEAWANRQAVIDGLKGQLIREGFVDNGGVLLRPPFGKTPDWGIVDTQRAKIDELQGRIDGALKILDGMRHNGAHRAIDILKKRGGK